MAFTKHLRERAARKLSPAGRAWLTWTLTFLQVFSGLSIPLLGLHTSPLIFGCACCWFYAPAAFRAKSLLEPIFHPATLFLPSQRSPLGLLESQGAGCYWTFSLSIRLLSSFICSSMFLNAMFFRGHLYGFLYASDFVKVDLGWIDDIPSCCSDANGWIEDGWMLNASVEGSSNWTDVCSAYELPLSRSVDWIIQPDGCLASNASLCLDKAEEKLLPAHPCAHRSYQQKITDACKKSPLLQHVPCLFSKDLQYDYDYLSTALSVCQLPQWFFSNFCVTSILYIRLTSQWRGVVLVFLACTLTVQVAPLVLAIFLFVMCLCVDQSIRMDLRFAVDAEARSMEGELMKEGKARLSFSGRCFFRLNLILMFLDVAGDMLSIYTFALSGHLWFGLFQGLILLRGIPDLVRIQRREGLLQAISLSLQANTLTDELHDLALQEKIVEGTMTSFLMAYGLMFTLENPTSFFLTVGKWILSLRSVTNGCYIQFHLMPGHPNTSRASSATAFLRYIGQDKVRIGDSELIE